MAKTSSDTAVEVHTDGSSLGNPGPGGYGIVLRSGDHYKEVSEGYRLTTNNRMELLSVIVALEMLKKPCRVTIFSDSRYVVDAIEKEWLFNWQRKGFKKAKNVDLWKRFLEIYPKHEVRLKWVKGHAGHEDNERCDALAVEAAEGTDLKVDEGYEEGWSNPYPGDQKK